MSKIFVSLALLQGCLTQIRTDSKRYHQLLPQAIFTMDRRLTWMDEGIAELERNASLPDRRAHAVPAAAVKRYADTHLYSNAVEGCELFRSQYEWHARLFLALIACLIALIGALVGRLGVLVFRRKTNALRSNIHRDVGSRPALR